MYRLIGVVLVMLTFFTIGHAQFKDISRPEVPGRFLAFISPISTSQQLDTMMMSLEGQGFKLALRDFVFTNEGKLKSFYAKIVSECPGDPAIYEGVTDFAAPEQYPLAALFIAQDCSVGSFTTTYDGMKNMYNGFFPDRDPELITYAWSGDYEQIKEVVWDRNFTLKPASKE